MQHFTTIYDIFCSSPSSRLFWISPADPPVLARVKMTKPLGRDALTKTAIVLPKWNRPVVVVARKSQVQILAVWIWPQNSQHLLFIVLWISGGFFLLASSKERGPQKVHPKSPQPGCKTEICSRKFPLDFCRSLCLKRSRAT